MQCSGDHRNSEDAICGGSLANTVMTTGLSMSFPFMNYIIFFDGSKLSDIGGYLDYDNQIVIISVGRIPGTEL